jgi:predicted aminopeptidase
VLYIKHDTAFNESFATAVEEAGVERFLTDRDMQDAFKAYSERKQFRRDLMALINATRDDLRTYYAETIDPDEKRLLKEHRVERLTDDLRQLLTESGRDPERWLWAPFNNARLISFSLYEGYLPAFRQMLADCDRDLPCFYAEAVRVSKLDDEGRDAYLVALASR